MTPPKLEVRLFVLPIVKVLAPSVVLPVLLNAPIVCEAPTLNVDPLATSTAASVPSAVTLLEFNVPVVIFTCVAVTRLVAAVANVTLPAPLLVMVRATVPSFNAPSVNNVLAAGVKVALPVKVVAPNVKAGVPLVALLPAARFNVLVPMLNVPKVCVMPALAAVALLELIVTLPPMVVL